jgi:hypothetical protein
MSHSGDGTGVKVIGSGGVILAHESADTPTAADSSEGSVTQDALFVPWENFYVIVGSSAAALTGLQFVVIALVAEARRKGKSETVSAFGTPTVVHFGVVLAAASVLSAPWQDATIPGVMLAMCGVGGVGYAGIVTARARRQTSYKPVLEDWLAHSILPLIAYSILLTGALFIERRDGGGLFAIGAATLLLLFIGIHNSWDSVAYVATDEYQSGSPTAGSTEK